ncbi:hypothetical protein N802_00660 [Knoellia sinensis KCTC 19936]|uniref:Bacterial spore germination immunoglobulin-like domain-containing protein n=1 Tax=Knoellia sinensis KCTC 19936 TaxID=1385520 RepID=A0A0A0JC92_9MICO|nr:Gmad2 immunoglobulin-like domain-containing protein [Knoellia sinensis]KGN34990.1 hypothetical protein N802_00660 [Knoellia sinensis KCTC 19936]
MTTQFDQSSTERELREALAQRAAEVHPSARLDEILRAAAEPEAVNVRRRWLAGIGIAAAAATVAGAVWASRPDSEPTLPANTPSATPTSSAPAPSASPSISPSASPTASPSASQPGTTAPTPSTSPPAVPPAPNQPTSSSALAIYRVGTNGGSANRPGLVREFKASGGSATESTRVSTAVEESLRRTDLWRGVTIEDVTVTSGRITLELSGPGSSAASANAARLGVSALVWTAQAVVGRGDVPVQITAAGGGRLLGHVATTSTFTRASTPPEALCDIWIDAPSPGASLRGSNVVVVRGQAVAWEANVEWELRSGDSTVREGFTTASVGAPSRGTFSIDLGRLDAGSYAIRAFTTSPEDGARVLAERVVTFTVR